MFPRAMSEDEIVRITKCKYDCQSQLGVVLYQWTDEKKAADKREAEEAGLHFTLDKGNGERYSFGIEELSKVQEVLNKASYNRGSLASAKLYANGEAVAVNRYDTATFTGGTVYLGKDALGSVRGATNDYGLLEERYEYDAFGKPYKGDLNSGVNLGYTGKPYDTTTGMYNYGYRDYQPEVARFTTIDPIRDGANWFAYVNNDPVNYIDLWGLDSMYSTYIQGSGKMVSTYVPNNPDGSIDYGNIKTYSFGTTNNVRNEENGLREKPDVMTMPAKGEPAEYYYPREFPVGTFDVLPSVPKGPNDSTFGSVFVPTTATQEVPTYGTAAPVPDAGGRYTPTGVQEDGGYGYHYSTSKSTLGCLRAETQEEADKFAELSDRALASGGKSTITVSKGR